MGQHFQNWVSVGAALAASPHVQRSALILLFGAAAVNGPLCDCKAIEQDAAIQLMAFVKANAAPLPHGLDNVPAASESEVFEMLDALAAGMSVDEIALCIGRPVADCWAVIASTF